MGLYQQPNDWSCGPFALKHALVALGCLADEDTISSVAQPHWCTGTNEVKLARAARQFGCDLPMIRRTSAEGALGTLVRYLNHAMPVLLCIDNWGHWITAVGHGKQRFVVLDSRNEPVLQVMSWPQLRNRWQYLEDRDARAKQLFDLYPVKPRSRPSVKALFSVARAQYLRRPENAHLAVYWDEYLEDLLEICRPISGVKSPALSMGEFLRRHQELLISRLLYWHGDIERDDVNRLLRNFRFVADTYGLVIPVHATRGAIADIAMLLGMWAAASRGVGEIYGSGRKREIPARRPAFQ